MEGTSFHNGSKKRSGLKLALWTWFSAGIDGLILVSMSCFFLVLSSFMMKASPQSMLSLFFKDQSFIFSMGILFVLSLWTYLIFMRAFIGASVGEWTCDLRLGEPLQRFQFSYVFKVIVRTTLILMTGVLVLPLISLILSRDLAGEISGLKIYSLE
ncbi:MAG: hypothetical protein A2622_12235 [Bdellovibrionales bacterium RIFCSPHIGHO2_01_FULL_40_29]|nr:MAG: hypothetical protein A2622_12235 [Bdellovibrionales bacterium RIFCSPHIGHO2_01_FULL_40_29]OFZ33019.1 MAG: hypothetical protein A3D17_09540 [Bdellovibrionales bacterium RIFCSPHIGHO2_02_FULL_40_15]